MISAEAIAKTPFFRGLPREQLELLAEIAIPRSYRRGEMIFTEGEEGKGFYLVLGGQVEIFKLSPEGKKQILHILGKGEPFGEVTVFAEVPFPAHAKAITRAEVAFFPKDSFIKLIKDYPHLPLNMLALLSQRLREFTSLIENLSLKEVSSRLATYLLYLSEREQGADEVTFEVPKGEVASLLGTIPETFSRALGRLVTLGLIESEGQRIRIRDREGLRNLAIFGKI